MSTEDLITWYRAQLDEDERIAQAASQAYPYSPGAEPPTAGVHWRWVAGPDWETVDLHAAEEFVAEPGYDCWLATVEEWPNDYGRMIPRVYMNSAVEVDIHAARLIARHDPSSVLADIAAKRAILELHVEATLGYTGLPAGDCTSCMNETWPCSTLRHLASAYADRPGYREEWRP